ncbi:MAG: DUF2807 domain-containing protein [Bacteroidia bacterium]|nr:DUF2807 domain-containing protein [Bacteroidia bacterium]
MKNLIFVFALVFTTILQAQEPITKTVGEFTALKAYDLINLELIKSKENKIVISGKNTEDVVVLNKNGTLKIRMKLEKIFDGNNTEVKLYFTTVDIIDANEGAYISSNHVFKQYELDLRAQEGGQIKLKVDTKVNEVRADSGASIELSGKTRTQDIRISTGGIFNGENLESEATNVTIKAGGEADVKADKILDIKITAGGDVYIHNKPEEVKERTTLGGRIKYVE